MENLEYLQRAITDGMALTDIVAAFEKMCQTSIKGEMILFETGIFSFTGEELFYFSLVRQVEDLDNDDGEGYYQIHVDVQYQPNHENAAFSETTWNGDLNENIFEYIRKSAVFEYVKSDKYIKVDVYMDEV